MAKPRILALYLPQFHPFPENDEWWGKGFTEWRSVARAVPLFKGHYQPHIPADLGFYDLRVPEVREQQAELAKEAGIEGFCYWHYWFGNGKRLMDRVFDEVLESGKPDFPFCLGWANHSWYAKNWSNRDVKGTDKLLIEQKYPGVEDIRAHYELVLKAFKDPRYVKYGNKPFFYIYDAPHAPTEMIGLWNQWAKEDGFDGIYFVGNVLYDVDIQPFLELGYNAMTRNRLLELSSERNSHFWQRQKFKFLKKYTQKPCEVFEYKDILSILCNYTDDSREEIIPNLIPNYDHSPRSGRIGHIFNNATPELFGEHCRQVFDIVSRKENPFVILRSWNEWGEGNYVEPDMKYGAKYLNVLRNELETI